MDANLIIYFKRVTCPQFDASSTILLKIALIWFPLWNTTSKFIFYCYRTYPHLWTKSIWKILPFEYLVSLSCTETNMFLCIMSKRIHSFILQRQSLLVSIKLVINVWQLYDPFNSSNGNSSKPQLIQSVIVIFTLYQPINWLSCLIIHLMFIWLLSVVFI